MRVENTDTVYCLTQLCHDGLTHQAHPAPGRGVEVVPGTTGGQRPWDQMDQYILSFLVFLLVLTFTAEFRYRIYAVSPVPEVKRRVSHQSPVSGSRNWLHTPTMSSIRLSWVADIPRADLGIPASRTRERQEVIMFRRETVRQSEVENRVGSLGCTEQPECDNGR